MHAYPDRKIDVLIVGAGPTGLVLALWLARLGLRPSIVDKTAGPGTTSRALAVQARTLEFYRQIGLADTVVERGRKAVAANLWVAGRRAARAVFGDLGAGLSPYPYALIFPQDEHELLLLRLAEVGVDVERQTELLDFAAQSRIRDTRWHDRHRLHRTPARQRRDPARPVRRLQKQCRKPSGKTIAC